MGEWMCRSMYINLGTGWMWKLHAPAYLSLWKGPSDTLCIEGWESLRACLVTMKKKRSLLLLEIEP
jgi:hypothetical protein